MASTEQRKIQIIADGQQVNASLQQMQASSRLLYNQLRKLPQGSDEFVKKSADLKKVNARLNSVKNDIRGTESAMSKLTGMAGQLGLAFGALSVVTKVADFFRGSSAAATEFESALSSLSSLTGAVGEDLKFYEEQAALIGQTTTLSASQAVEAFKLMGSARPDLLANKEALAAVTREAVILAEAAEIDLPSATQALAGAMNQFKLPAEDATRVINALAAGSKEGAAAIPEISQAMDKFGPIAQAFNVSVEESVGLIETLAESNIKGAEAGTALRNVLNNMAAVKALPPTAIAEMEKYGVNIEKVSDKSIPLNERLREFSKISGDAVSLTKVFGKENMVAGQIILQNVDKFENLTDAVTGTNTATEQARINTDNLAGDQKAMASAFEAVQISVGKFLNEGLRPLVKVTTAVLLGFMELPKFLKENWDLFAALGIAVVTFNSAQIAATASTLAHTAVEKGRAVATRASAIAQGLLNAVMSANPIGLVVSAIGLLVGAFVILYNRSENVRAGIQVLFDVFKSAFGGMVEAIKNPKQAFMDFVDFIQNNLMNRIKSVGLGFQALKKIISGDFAEGFKDLGNAYIQGFTGIENGIDKIGNAISKKKEELAADVGETMDAVNTETAAKTDEGTAIVQKGVDDQLAVIEAGNEKQVAAEKAKQEKIKALREEYQKAREATEIAIKELKIAAIKDETERELAELDFKHEQELEKLEEQRAALIANDAITEEERNAALLALKEQQRLMEAEAETARAAIREEKRIADEAKELSDLEAKQQMQLAKLEEGLLNVNQTEQQQFEARLALQRKFAENKLALLNAQGKGETLEAQKLKNEILSIDAELVEGRNEFARAEKEFREKMINAGADALQEGISITADLLGKDEESRKKHGKKIKALQIANVVIDGIREVAAIWKNYNASPMNILVPGSGAVLAGIQTALAVGRTVGAVAKIQSTQFAEGGATKRGKVIDMMYNSATGQYSWSGGRVKDVGTFANGGHVNSASTGLIGEKGAEWVAPNWMMRSPAYANTIGWLESERQKSAPRAFATGGATASTAMSRAPRSPEAQNAMQGMNDLMMEFAKFTNEIKTWQRELKVIQPLTETRSGLDRLNSIEMEGRITRSA